jgi:Flp pilus assembly protein TadD
MQANGAWPARSESEHRLRQAEETLARSPDDPAARFERACRLDQLGCLDEAQQAYLDVLALDLSHAGALRQLAGLLSRRGYVSAARSVLAQALAFHPDDAMAHASLGHLLREAGETTLARREYEAALRTDPAQAEAHQGMSYLLDGIDEDAAARHRRAGFAGRVLTSHPCRGAMPPVVVLKLVSACGGNVVTRHLLDDRIFLTYTLVADYADPGIALPSHDLVFNAIGDAERCGAALESAEWLLARIAAPVVNPPGRIRPTTRSGNAEALGRLQGVIAPRSATLPRAALAGPLPAGFGFPILLRSPGFHTGQNFVQVDTPAELAAARETLPGAHLTLIERLDARGADGFWRKYRVMMVNGALLPLHLAISPHWKVHHFTADMQDRPEHRDEEAAFLADMQAVLGPSALAALGRIGAALGLDYGGIDFALSPRGEILLFEANATMTVIPPVPGSVWQYREAAVRAVIGRTEAMLLHKAGRSPRA